MPLSRCGALGSQQKGALALVGLRACWRCRVQTAGGPLAGTLDRVYCDSSFGLLAVGGALYFLAGADRDTHPGHQARRHLVQMAFLARGRRRLGWQGSLMTGLYVLLYWYPELHWATRTAGARPRRAGAFRSTRWRMAS